MKHSALTVLLTLSCAVAGVEALSAQERARRSIEGPLTAETVTRSLLLEPAVAASEVPVEVSLLIRVEFELDSADLTKNAEGDLDIVAAALNDPRMKEASVKLEGHTDASGPADYNLRLSQRRAETVRNYLIHRGVARLRLTAVGYGGERLRSRYAPADGRQRRVEIVRVVR